MSLAQIRLSPATAAASCRRMLALGMLAAFFCGSAMAAMIGEITVRSRLGEPLLAEIPIYDMQPGEEQHLVASLASQVAFEEADSQRTAAMEGLEFQLVRVGPQWLIKVTSEKPMREPLVGVLLELRADGKPYWREYAIVPDEAIDVALDEMETPTLPEPSSVAIASSDDAQSSGDGVVAASGDDAGTGSDQVANADAVTGANDVSAADDSADPTAQTEMAGISPQAAVRFLKQRSQFANDEGATSRAASHDGNRSVSGGVARASRIPKTLKDQLKLSKAGTSKPGASKQDEDKLANQYAEKEAASRIAELEKNLTNLRGALDERDKVASSPNAPASPPDPAPVAARSVTPSIVTRFNQLIGGQHSRSAMLTLAMAMMFVGWLVIRKPLTDKADKS